MYLEHFNLHTSPFAEEVDPSVFFPGGGREEIRQGILRDIHSGRPLIKLTGVEGSGKTLMCRVVAEDLGDDVEVVYLDDPVGSFDELLRVVCVDLGMLPVDSREDLQEVLKEQLQERTERGVRVLLVLDNAEKIFLAALERLLRLLCELKAYSFSLLLSGRPALEANLEQLTVYCTGVEVDGGYELTALSREETAAYLEYRLQAAGLDRERQDDVFTDEAVERIYARAGGNPRLTSILAEESLQKSCSEKSFMVLLDHVDAESGGRTARRPRRRTSASRRTGNRRLIFIAAAAILVIAGGFYFYPGSEKTPPAALPPQAAFTPEPSPIPPGEAPSAAESLDTPAPAPPRPERTKPVEDTQASLPVVEERSVEKSVPVSERKPEPAAPPSAPAGKAEEQPAVISLEPGRIKTPPEPVRAEPVKRKQVVTVGKLELSESEPQELITPEKQSVAVTSVAEESSGPVIANGRNGDQLFEERLRASATWLAGAYRSEYTIQLMVLASEQAPENVKKFLVQDPYFEIIDQLYILRKKTTPPTLFLFYGTFASMEEARQARNRMPIFLRKHHPYALSIEDALTKTED